jgi:multidrug efflux pump subunit AcrA (membrane-fusion protein)
MSARVLRVRVKPGQRVRAGEPLLDVLLPELLKAAGTLSAANLRIEAYEARKARLSPLVKEGLARASELSELEANLASARAEREAARATLRVAGVNEAQAQALLTSNGTLTLRAPMDAVVVQLVARPGEIREPNAGPLLELVSEGSVQVEARLMITPPTDAQFAWMAGGTPVPLALDTLSPRASPEDGARLAWFHALDAAHAPVPGSLGRVRLRAQPGWTAVPISALIQRGESVYVLVREGATTRARPVSVVLRSSSETIVTGIPANAQIAADAARVVETPP